MGKTKNILMFALLIIFAFSVAQISLSVGLNAQAEVLSPYDDGALSLDVNYTPGQLTLTASPGSDGYQFWIKQKVPTDALSGVNEQFIWQLVGEGYSSSNIASVTVTEGDEGNIDTYLDENDKFNAIVRVKNEGVLLGEVYGSYSKTDAGVPAITGITLNGKEYYDNIVVSGNTLDIKVNGNLTGMSYNVLHKGVSKSGGPKNSGMNAYYEFTGFGIDWLKEGLNILALQAENGGNIVQKGIRLYVVKDYVASERPAIMSLTAAADTDTDGEGVDEAVAGQFHFTMKVRHSDDSPLTKEEAQSLDYKLISGSKEDVTGTPELSEEENLVLDGDNCANILFTIDYGADKYGIYQTTATVARQEIIGYDDKFITDYAGYARPAELKQKGEVLVSEDPEVYEEKYTGISAGSTIKITAFEAGIGGSADNLKYAFYREDATGWVLIRDYPEGATSGDTLYWKPSKPGWYKIQARVKKDGAGSYEKAVTKMYEITGGGLNGTVAVEFYDYATEEITDSLIAGKPYKIKAVFDDGDIESNTEDVVLYMFTLTSPNLGKVYLNNFTTSPYYIFVPGREDSYRITARVIHMTSFGYEDLSSFTDISAYVQQIDENTSEYFYDFDKTSTGDYSVDISSLSNTPSKLKIDSTNVPFTVDGTNLTIQRDNISAKPAGDYNAEFISGGNMYIRKVAVVDKIITNADELLQIQTYGGIQATASTNIPDSNSDGINDYNYSGYFVLGNDIDLTGETVTSLYWTDTAGNGTTKDTFFSKTPASSDGFSGTFDGRGHTISGGTYGKGGLFGTVSTTGTVKNVAIVGANIVYSSVNLASYVVISGYFMGTLKDVLIDGIVDDTTPADGKGADVNSGGFMVFDGRYANIENVVIYYENTVSNTATSPICRGVTLEKVPACTNVYVFTDHQNLVGGNTATWAGVTKYTYDNKLSDSGVSVQGLTAPFWDLSGDKASFN